MAIPTARQIADTPIAPNISFLISLYHFNADYTTMKDGVNSMVARVLTIIVQLFKMSIAELCQ